MPHIHQRAWRSNVHHVKRLNHFHRPDGQQSTKTLPPALLSGNLLEKTLSYVKFFDYSLPQLLIDHSTDPLQNTSRRSVQTDSTSSSDGRFANHEMIIRRNGETTVLRPKPDLVLGSGFTTVLRPSSLLPSHPSIMPRSQVSASSFSIMNKMSARKQPEQTSIIKPKRQNRHQPKRCNENAFEPQHYSGNGIHPKNNLSRELVPQHFPQQPSHEPQHYSGIHSENNFPRELVPQNFPQQPLHESQHYNGNGIHPSNNFPREFVPQAFSQQPSHEPQHCSGNGIHPNNNLPMALVSQNFPQQPLHEPQHYSGNGIHPNNNLPREFVPPNFPQQPSHEPQHYSGIHSENNFPRELVPQNFPRQPSHEPQYYSGNHIHATNNLSREAVTQNFPQQPLHESSLVQFFKQSLHQMIQAENHLSPQPMPLMSILPEYHSPPPNHYNQPPMVPRFENKCFTPDAFQPTSFDPPQFRPPLNPPAFHQSAYDIRPQQQQQHYQPPPNFSSHSQVCVKSWTAPHSWSPTDEHFPSLPR